MNHNIIIWYEDGFRQHLWKGRDPHVENQHYMHWLSGISQKDRNAMSK